MALLGIDLGGSKLALAIFSDKGEILLKESFPVGNRQGKEVGSLVTDHVSRLMKYSTSKKDDILSIGISVPGIAHSSTGTVWAPNIPGWDNYPLVGEVQAIAEGIPVTMDSDRACYILGETWKGNASGCSDAIFLSVGTGIGAGILINGQILRGKNDIAGCIGWMALERPYYDKYIACGCFEYHSSGEGIAKVARAYLQENKEYQGSLRKKIVEEVTSVDVFIAYDDGDPLAAEVINSAIEFWGMAVANLVSLFNPEKIIFGGGVFGPAKRFLGEIRKEAEKWAQPVSIKLVEMDVSSLGGDAGVYGAGFLALKCLPGNLNSKI